MGEAEEIGLLKALLIGLLIALPIGLLKALLIGLLIALPIGLLKALLIGLLIALPIEKRREKKRLTKKRLPNPRKDHLPMIEKFPLKV
jgi:predicted lipid-binding transport protein (Tim44 family)